MYSVNPLISSTMVDSSSSGCGSIFHVTSCLASSMTVVSSVVWLLMQNGSFCLQNYVLYAILVSQLSLIWHFSSLCWKSFFAVDVWIWILDYSLGISRNFRNARQEDAHEYMVNLLESMHKCCLPSGVPSESPSAYEKSLVHKIFGGRLRSQVTGFYIPLFFLKVKLRGLSYFVWD